MTYLKFTIWPRSNSRRLTYNLRDVYKAILEAGLQPTRHEQGWLVETFVTTKEQRKELEHNLRQVHRNLPYTIQQVGATQ